MSLESHSVTQPKSTPPTTTVDAPSQNKELKQVEGSAHLKAPSTVAALPKPDTDGSALKHIGYSGPWLEVISDKHAAIEQGLPKEVGQKLEDRLAKMDNVSRATVMNLLHFGWKERGGTTKETRLAIRTAVASFIARGGSLADAQKLRTALVGQNKPTISAVTTELNRSLDPTLTKAFDQRYDQASIKDQTRIEKLVTLPIDKGSASQLAKNVSIQSALTAALAHGMSLDAAEKLQAHLQTLPADACAKLATDLGQPGVNPLKALSQNLFSPLSKTLRQDFAALKDVLLAFPADPSKANQFAHCDACVSIARDANGVLKFDNVSAALVRVGPPGPYPKLSQAQVNGIKGSFVQTIGTKYSRLGVPLELMGAFKKENDARHLKGLPPLPLKDFAASWKANGKDAVAKYQRGDCIGLAETIVDDLAQHGITGYLAGYYNGELARQRVDGGVVNPNDTALKTGYMTHADVLIPYTDESGQEKILLLTPGMGDKEPDKWFQNLDADAPAIISRRVSESGGSVDHSPLEKAQLGFLTNLQLTNNKWDAESELFGVDLVKGKIYLNSGATTGLRNQHGIDVSPGEKGISLDFRDALVHPNDKVDVKIWNPATSVYDSVPTNKMGALCLFLFAVQDQFKQPFGFVENTLELLKNEKEYQQDLLWESVRNLHKI